MSFLLRHVTSRSWVRAAEIPLGGGLPVWAVRDFVPSERDREGLSVFEVEDEIEALQVAAAFAFHSDKLDGGSTIFVGAKSQDLSERGVDLRTIPGTLNHLFADSRHREIMIPDLSTLDRVVRTFISGEMFSFEGKEAGAAARLSAQQEQFSYLNLSKLSLATNWRGKNLMRFIDDRFVVVRGVPQQS